MNKYFERYKKTGAANNIKSGMNVFAARIQKKLNRLSAVIIFIDITALHMFR